MEYAEYQNIVEYCPNFEVCRSIGYKVIFDCFDKRCRDCELTFRKNLIITNVDNFECPICYETTQRVVKHPAECDHQFCVKCFKKLFNMEDRILFNNIPCPSGHQYSFRPCCIDDFISMENYIEINGVQEEEIEENISDTNNENCPLCRKNASEAPNRSW